jgi:4-hydroxy-4-methyl-2-oxoglutarate aldolase
MSILNAAQLDELAGFDTPTVCNALERFKIRKSTEGFMHPAIRSVFPDRKPLVGYACTAKVSALYPPTEEQKALLFDYYQSVLDSPGRPVAVIEDLDDSPVGSFWGEVQATVHKSIGCSGVITNGGVRDLDEVKSLDFSYFSSCVLVSHGYIHVESVGEPVRIGGLVVRPGDLMHADKHGVLLIPSEVAAELAEACRLTQRAEEPVLKGCADAGEGGVTVEMLRRWREEMQALRAGK